MTLRTFLWLALLLVSFIALPGCSGCNWSKGSSASSKAGEEKKKTDEETLAELEKRKKKLEKPKADFEPLQVRMLPSNDPSPSQKHPSLFVKPGHWIAVSETAKTNNFDFPGELRTFVEHAATQEPLEIEDTTVRMSNSCPAILPKGQTKRIESLFYVPRRKKELSGSYSVRSDLYASGTGTKQDPGGGLVSPSLRDYEHLIVVLASGSSSPAAYTHFDKLLSVKMPDVEATEGSTLRHYFVIRPTVERSAPLPSHPLAWTTIAYVFWDDLDPAVLTNQQQQAMLDWIHWGGQLIISGPNSLDKLRGSFLAPYLPGEQTQTSKLTQADFEELNSNYSLTHGPRWQPTDGKAPKGEKLLNIVISEERPMVGVELQLHAAAAKMEGTGGLVVERRVGGGRIAVTRFPLTDVRIKQWKNFDGFCNAVLLRKPSRVFDQDSLAMLTVKWDDPYLNHMLLDARLGSTLRYFTRDVAFEEDKWQPEAAGVASNTNDPTTERRGRVGSRGLGGGQPVFGQPGFVPGFPGFNYNAPEKVRPDTATVHPPIDDWHFAGYGGTRPDDEQKFRKDLLRDPRAQRPDPPGVAAWNDQGAASAAARQILTEAAGIEIPSADFVVKVLLIYLVVLVPLNWLVFWLIGKVEWAWIAAPLISLVGAGAVIRLAQLDIGFARSRTEVAVLEIQGGYERAHLTRYTALYTSLSSSYTLSFDEPASLAAPFPSGKQDEALLAISNYSDVMFRRGSETALSGVQVSSNSTGMVHSEQMLSLGNSDKTLETLRLVGDVTRGYSVSNTTDLTIRNIGVFRRVDAGYARSRRQGLEGMQIEAAYVERLDPASSAVLRFQPLTLEKASESDKTPLPRVWMTEWNQVPILAGQAATPSEDPNQTEDKLVGIRLTRLARLAADRLRLLPGDVRLVGWTDQRLPGMKISPEAPQNRTYTLVLAHLTRGFLPAARPDKNLAEDFIDPTILDPEPDVTTPSDGIDRDPQEPAASGN